MLYASLNRGGNYYTIFGAYFAFVVSYNIRMIVVIIAGGSGTRLWPLSTPDYPKHLLSLSNERSLLQNTYDRVEKVTSSDKIFVISEVGHVDHVRSQLSGLPKENILAEPGRRGTASCIAWALTIVKKKDLSADESILFLWADHMIRSTDGFVATALKAGELAAEKKKIAFIGVEPTYPSIALGYVKKGASVAKWRDAYEFDGFVEKPNKRVAEEYFASGKYLWNTGYLVGTLNTFEHMFKDYAPDMQNRYSILLNSKKTPEAYLGLESIAVEYVFSQLIKDALVIPGTFDWMDVGSFNDLHGVSLQDDEGNHIKGGSVAVEDTTNSYIHNETDIPTAVIGLDNVVVVHTKNGVLVANKNYSHKVGDIAKKLQK